MKIIVVFVMSLFSFFANCSSAEMTGQIIDSRTGVPIDDVTIVVQWTRTKGMPGQAYHEVQRIIEVVSDNAGKFRVPARHNPLDDPPIILIFKPGYIPWRNDYIFPSFKKKTDIKWKNNNIVRLSKLTDEYSKETYHYFLSTGIIGSNFESTPRYSAFKIKTSKASRQEMKNKKNR